MPGPGRLSARAEANAARISSAVHGSGDWVWKKSCSASSVRASRCDSSTPSERSTGNSSSASRARTPTIARDPSAVPSSGTPRASAIRSSWPGHVAALALERRRQHEADGEAVGNVEDATDGLPQRVLGGAVGDVHREPRHQARARHLRPRRTVGRVAVDDRERPAGQPDRLQRDRVADRRAHARHHPGDRLGNRVDTGVGGHRRRDRMRQQRIHERVLGTQRRAGDAGLPGLGRIRDHRAAGDLRSGSGGRRARRSAGPPGPGTRARAQPGTRRTSSRAGRTAAPPWRCRSPSRRRSRAPRGAGRRRAAAAAESTTSIVGSPGALTKRSTSIPGPASAATLRGHVLVALLEARVDHQHHAPGTVSRDDLGQLAGDAVAESDPDRQVVGEGRHARDRGHGITGHVMVRSPYQ